MDISNYIPKFSALSLGSGNIFGLLVLVCVFLFVLSIGRTRTLVSLLAVYVAFVIQAIFPYFGWLQKNATSFTKDLALLRVGLLLIAYVVAFLLLNRSVLKNRFNQSESSYISVILMGLAQLGFLASIILNLAPSQQHYIPAYVLPYVANQKALFYWALAPLLLMVFQNRD